MVGNYCPRLQTEQSNHVEMQQWHGLKQTMVYVPFYLPYTPWNHQMPVLLLSLVNHNWGREKALQSFSLHNMEAAVTVKVCWSLFMHGVIRAGGRHRLCLWSWKKGWAEYVSVGGRVTLCWSGRRLHHIFLFLHSQSMLVNAHNFKVNIVQLS